MIPPEPFEDVRRARDQYAKERDVLAEALAAVLDLADRWARDPFPFPNVAETLRAVVAAPVAAAPQHVAARLEAYGHLARLRAEIEAAQRTAEPPTVAQAARRIADYYQGWDGADSQARDITSAAFERFANLLEGK